MTSQRPMRTATPPPENAVKTFHYLLAVTLSGGTGAAIAQNAPLPDPPSEVQLRNAQPVPPILPGMLSAGVTRDGATAPAEQAADPSASTDDSAQADDAAHAVQTDSAEGGTAADAGRYYRQAQAPSAHAVTDGDAAPLSDASGAGGDDIVSSIEDPKP